MPGLYVHVPFCVRKCRYCDFYSIPTGQDPLPRQPVARYLDALAVEMSLCPADFRPDTIFIGGGTPTELPDPDFARLLELVRGRARDAEIVEWTCECNPGTLSRTKADLMRTAGVNRVSLGVQSFDRRSLDFLGRIHSAEDAVAGFHLLRDAGFENISLDLMYGIPGAATEVVRADLEKLIALHSEHASCYCLIFEDGTPLAELRAKGLVRETDDETELEQYSLIRAGLGAVGYRHYEISNFALPGRECRHNLLYWGCGEYIGCGPSAHSHWRGERCSNARNLQDYCDQLLSGRTARAFSERLPPEAKARETLVMGLRRLDGVSRDAFLRETGFDYRALRGPAIEWLRRERLIEDDGDRLRLTEAGLFVSDSVFAELV
jgi:oxygen-independent coproporphyrinogen-3 oxidase